MTELLRGFGKVINLWPETDYRAYIPSEPPSSLAWEQVGEHIAKALVVEAVKLQNDDAVVFKLNLAIKEIERKDAFSFCKLTPHQATIINEQKTRSNENCCRGA